MYTTVFRFLLSSCIALLAAFSIACTSVPISSMYSLSKIDPMKTDPEQIRVAIRVDESVNASHSSASIVMAYKVEDGSLNEEHTFNVQLNSAQTLTPKLLKGMEPGEKVTVMSLTPEDARIMRDFQTRLFQYKADKIKGEGSFSLNVGKLCLEEELPEDSVSLTLFLKTEYNEDYIVFIRTQLSDLFAKTDSEIDKLPFCEDMLAADV
jgi:hypothetical protein